MYIARKLLQSRKNKNRIEIPKTISAAIYNLNFEFELFSDRLLPKNVNPLVPIRVNSTQILELENLKIEVEVFELSLLNWVESALSVNLSDDPRIASKQALKRIESNYHNLAPKLRRVVKTKNLIEKFNIEVFPAAVVDNRFVFYGTDDLLLVIRKWRALQ